MIVLTKTMNHLSHKLHSKWDHRHKTESKSLSLSSQNFHTKLSDSLHQLLTDPLLTIHGNRITIPLSRFPKLLNLFKIMNTAFSELVSEIDCPITRWDDAIVDDYFSYTLSLLKLLNSITSSLSRLRTSRLPLLHALSLIDVSYSSAIKRLKPMVGGGGGSRSVDGGGEFRGRLGGERAVRDAKGKVVYEAVKEMKSIGLWVCGILLCGLDLEAGKDLVFPELEGSFGLGIGEGVEVEVKEVKQVNEAVGEVVGCLVKGGGGVERSAMVLRRKLEEFEKAMEEAEKSVSCLFSEVLANRNQMLDCIRIR